MYNVKNQTMENICHIVIYLKVKVLVPQSCLTLYDITDCSPLGSSVHGILQARIQETWVRSLDEKDPLEQGIATHSSILAWRIPWTEEPGGL